MGDKPPMASPRAFVAKRRLVLPEELSPKMSLAARIRVIYGDTDQMGVVYHGNYARYLEHARVERMRQLGVHYHDMEAAGFGLPVVDLAFSFLSPARFDDMVSVYVGVTRVTPARVNFCYRLTVEAGDRHGLDTTLELCLAESRHGCLDLRERSATRLPDVFFEQLRAQVVEVTEPRT